MEYKYYDMTNYRVSYKNRAPKFMRSTRRTAFSICMNNYAITLFTNTHSKYVLLRWAERARACN